MMDANDQRATSQAAAPDEATRRPRRRRLNAEDREEIILRVAMSYFAEHGLSAGTIQLARRIGITQPLLYKYFPTKDDLVKRVYERLIGQNWNPTWELMLEDSSVPLRDRLKTFYGEYVTDVLTYEHVRLFLFSGLSRSEFNSAYYAVLSKRILERIARAMRAEYGTPRRSRSIGKTELELVQSLHAVIYHLAFRKYVHGEALGDLAKLVDDKVDAFLDGALETIKAQRRPARRAAGQPR